MTSPVEWIGIQCPNCKNLYTDWRRPSVNLDLDDFTEEYLDECASAACPQCHFKGYFDLLTIEDNQFIL
jgi:hypothetical protein